MRVAIITFHRAHNYGSILQAYALQRFFVVKGIECEIIDFSNDAQQEMYRVLRKRLSFHNVLRNLSTLLFYPEIKRDYVEFEAFINSKLKMTKERFIDCFELKQIEGQYDLFIAGSDQIWNLKCPDHDDAYFLPNINVKKVAYAPSFGAENIMNNDDVDWRKYATLISDFKGLSVREKNGKAWIYEMTGVIPRLLIDPTLFWDRVVWEELEYKRPLFHGRYILYYSFHFSQEINKIVHKISKKYKLPVVMLNPRAWIYTGCCWKCFKLAKHSGPDAFLRVINDAEIVLSNSFHGTVFSVIYKKNFWFLYGDVQNENDDRAKTLVQQLGIENRIVYASDADNVDYNTPINYSSVEMQISELREEAFGFLNELMMGTD